MSRPMELPHQSPSANISNPSNLSVVNTILLVRSAPETSSAVDEVIELVIVEVIVLVVAEVVGGIIASKICPYTPQP
ncbi:MAG TPA: hypothetical protein ENH96_06000 [Chlamydiae bacterium]|nr:hypothetical protein [Chlamydiota bacterium]